MQADANLNVSFENLYIKNWSNSYLEYMEYYL